MLVTAQRWTCQHEWVMHSKLAQQGGLGAGMIEDIRNGREPKECWTRKSGSTTSASKPTPAA